MSRKKKRIAALAICSVLLTGFVMIAVITSAASMVMAGGASREEAVEFDIDEYIGGQAGPLAWPVPGCKTITSGYGWRNCPFHGREFHGGIDIAASKGTLIVAAEAGTVMQAGWNGGFGNCVRLLHGNMTTQYGHMSKILVITGQKVKKGQPIGKVGSTGSSTGPHLDFRVFVGGNSVNPLKYVR